METTGNKLLTNANNAELCSFEQVLEITMIAFKNIHSAFNGYYAGAQTFATLVCKHFLQLFCST
jgi:hypothetical protein